MYLGIEVYKCSFSSGVWLIINWGGGIAEKECSGQYFRGFYFVFLYSVYSGITSNCVTSLRI